MNKMSFYKLYLPALYKSLKDFPPNLDYGDNTFIKDAEYYMDESAVGIVDNYLNVHQDDSFLNKVAYYYDALAHGFEEIGSVPLEVYYSQIIEEMNILKEKYKIDI